jgi:hypothetical protein
LLDRERKPMCVTNLIPIGTNKFSTIEVG